MDYLSISKSIGEIILQNRNWNTSQILDLMMLLAGTYFLKVKSKKEQCVFKFIKE
jgi:hypothetical protein